MTKKLTILLLALAALGCSPRSADPVDYVNPFIGTGFHGHTYPGATTPFGMVQLSPDTRAGNWDACAGYHYSDTTIDGFSHTHLSGTGCADLADILFHPTTREIVIHDGECVLQPYFFSHDDERASCGYYAVTLPDVNIGVELTPYGRTPLYLCGQRSPAGDRRSAAYGHRGEDRPVRTPPDGSLRAGRHASHAGVGARSVCILRGPLLGAVRRRAAVGGQAGRADLRARRADAHDRRGTVVRQRRKRPYEFACGGSRTGFRRRACPRRRAVAQSAGRHRRRRRLARRDDQLLYGAVPYETDAQSDERRERRVPPPRPDRRADARREVLLLDVLAVGYFPGVEPAPDAGRYRAGERHDPQHARHVRFNGRTSDLAAGFGRDGHDDRLPCRVGHRRRLPEGNSRL